MKYSILIALILVASLCHGGVIRLKNGQVLRGELVEETEQQVTFRFELGTMTINRDQIESIETSENNPSPPVKQITSIGERFRPMALTGSGPQNLEDSLVRLRAKRMNAIDAQRAVDRLQSETQRMQWDQDNLLRQWKVLQPQTSTAQQEILAYNRKVTDFNTLKAQYVQQLMTCEQSACSLSRERQLEELERLGQALETSSRAMEQAQSQVDRHHSLIEQANNLANRIQVSKAAIEENDIRVRTHYRSIADYTSQLAACGHELERWMQKNAPLSESEQTFGTQMKSELVTYHQEFINIDIPVEVRSGNLVVTATINHSGQGAFIFDTGASWVVMTKDFAELHGIDTSDSRPVRMTVADGRIVSAQQITLNSVCVGAACAERVVAVVTNDPPGQGIDGLLGMSFLQYFQIHLDGGRRSVTLTQLQPNQ